MEVQVLAALGAHDSPFHQFHISSTMVPLNMFSSLIGLHENITGYYSSWFENEHLYIQMELCDCSLSFRRSSQPFTENEALGVLYQVYSY